MAVRDFANIYTQGPRAAGPRTAGVYVSKIPIRCGISSDLRLAKISTTWNIFFVSLKQGSLILLLIQQTIYNNDALWR